MPAVHIDGFTAESVTDPVMVFIAVWAVMMPELTHAVIRQHKSFSILVIFCSRFIKNGAKCRIKKV